MRKNAFNQRHLTLLMPIAMNMPKPTFKAVAETAKKAVFFSVVMKSLSPASSTKLSTPTYSGSEKKSQSKKDMPSPEIVGIRKKTKKLKSVGRMKK